MALPGESQQGPSTYDSPSTEVDPANLDSFAKFLRELADEWNGEDKPARKMDAQEPGSALWPRFGTFQSAQTLEDRYSEAHSGMQAAFAQVHELLTGLAEATDKIAENYRGAEDLATADVGQVESLLSEHVVVETESEGAPEVDGAEGAEDASEQSEPADDAGTGDNEPT